MHIYSLRTLYSPLITLTPEIVQNSDYQPIPHNLRTIASTCLQLCWDFMMGVLECSGTMWCYTSIDFICKGLNQSQLCTVWDRNKKWLAFYPYVWDQSCHKLIWLLCCGWDSFASCAQEGSTIEQFFFGGLLHVEVVSNRTMIDLFKSLVTSISKGLNNLRPRATSCGFCEVL